MCGDKQNQKTENGYTREEVVCNICNTNDEEFLFYAPERIVRCRRCGLMYSNPRLNANSLEKIYSEEYFLTKGAILGVEENYIEDERIITLSMRARMKKVELFANKRGHLLDIGCAAGFSLLVAQERGWDAEGVECSEYCVNYARSRGLRVYQGTLDDYPGQEESMDAITMWDYLEHSPNPLSDLRICASLLKKGGVILFSVPNIDSWSFRLRRKKWIGFKNIEHLYFFSRKTLATLAHMAGLNMEAHFYHGKYVPLSFFLSHIKYYLQFKPLLNLIEKISNSKKAKLITFYCNPYDILNVVLRK